MDFAQLIQTGENYAGISFDYKGTPEAGMLAWLDNKEMKTWWKAENVIIDPFPEGIFYISWSVKNGSETHAIYGVMNIVDTEQHQIEITKIYYMSPAGKLGPLHLKIRFEQASEGLTTLHLLHTHSHKGELQKHYNAAVFASWPKTFGLLKKYLETPY